VTVILALVALAGDDVATGVRPWLPLASLAALPVGYLVGRVGVRLARRGAP
jgi:hypothetical protein